jgi:hypothetical protein
MDTLKEKIVAKAKEFRDASISISKHNEKFLELKQANDMKIQEGEGTTPLSYTDFMQNHQPCLDDYNRIEVATKSLFELVDELTVIEGGSSPE